MVLPQKIERYLAKHPVLSTQAAQKLGIDRPLLHYYEKKGILRRVERGVYTADDSFLLDSLGAFLPYVVRWPEAVISGVSALQYHGLSDEDYRVRWLTFPQSQRVRAPANVRVVYAQGLFYSLGIQRVSKHKAIFKIYEPEKALIDVFKYGEFEVAMKSLRHYLKRPTRDLKKLSEYGQKLRHSLDDKVRILLAE